MKATRLNHHRVFLTAVLVGILVIAGCAGTSDWSRTLDAERQRVKIASSSLEQRTYEVSKEKLIKAFINAFSNKNLTVLTLEEGAGYMMSEGPQFLTPEILTNLSRERDNQFRSQLGGIQAGKYLIPKIATLRISVNLYDKEKNRTRAKVKVNHIQKNCMLCENGICTGYKVQEQYCPLSPTMVLMWYQQLWDEIEKSIFMQRETILK